MNFKELQGKVLTSIDGLEKYSDEVTLNFEDGTKARMFHMQDCCECVRVEDYDLCFRDNKPSGVVESFYESSRDAEAGECIESGTWTFYHLNTSEGHLMIRWLGESNGYYSESVDVEIS